MRNAYHVLYFKDSESIEDILTLMGATNASLEIMSAKMEKDLRNHANRRTNFDIANIGRIVQAGESQRLAVEKIARTTGLDSLPESLQKIAKIRLDNPDATLEQIRELLDEPISRSV
jgi:DNA-binding protein WhiA